MRIGDCEVVLEVTDDGASRAAARAAAAASGGHGTNQPLVRAGIRAMLDQADNLALIGEAADGRAAVELARRERPDVLLMDIRMPVLDGIEATRRITSDSATAMVKVVVLTIFDVDEYVCSTC